MIENESGPKGKQRGNMKMKTRPGVKKALHVHCSLMGLTGGLCYVSLKIRQSKMGKCCYTSPVRVTQWPSSMQGHTETDRHTHTHAHTHTAKDCSDPMTQFGLLRTFMSLWHWREDLCIKVKHPRPWTFRQASTSRAAWHSQDVPKGKCVCKAVYL